jgi:hypothetical protein
LLGRVQGAVADALQIAAQRMFSFPVDRRGVRKPRTSLPATGANGGGCAHCNRSGTAGGQRAIALALNVSEVSASRGLGSAEGHCRSAATTGTGPPTPTLARPDTSDPGVSLARSGGLRLPRRGLDPRPDCPGHPRGVRGSLPQGPRGQTPGATARAAPDADPPCHPARRASHPTLASRGLARSAPDRPLPTIPHPVRRLRTLGTSRSQILYRITIPLLWPALSASGCSVFLLSMNESLVG